MQWPTKTDRELKLYQCCGYLHPHDYTNMTRAGLEIKKNSKLPLATIKEKMVAKCKNAVTTPTEWTDM